MDARSRAEGFLGRILSRQRLRVDLDLGLWYDGNINGAPEADTLATPALGNLVFDLEERRCWGGEAFAANLRTGLAPEQALDAEWRVGLASRVWVTYHDGRPGEVDSAGRSLALSVSRRTGPDCLTLGGTVACETPDLRELLKLDLDNYTANDPGVLRETASRIRMAGIQVYTRPTLLNDAIRKASLQALYIPDRRRILLDASLPKLKHRWSEGHEIGHSLLPWHEAIMLGDNSLTLTPACQEEVEAQANLLRDGCSSCASGSPMRRVPSNRRSKRCGRSRGYSAIRSRRSFTASSNPSVPTGMWWA